MITETYEQPPETMGRFSVEIALANNWDVALASAGALPDDQVRRVTIDGLVDSGAAMLVLPESVVDQLGLPDAGRVSVRYADQRQEIRRRVSNVLLSFGGREAVFTAVVEPSRTTALIGAIVLEELDLLIDCKLQTLKPRDPDDIISEIESHHHEGEA